MIYSRSWSSSDFLGTGTGSDPQLSLAQVYFCLDPVPKKIIPNPGKNSGSGFTTVLKSSYNFCAAPVLVSFYLLFLFRRPHFSVVVLSFLIWTLYILYCSLYSQRKIMQLFPALTKHLVSMTTTVRHGCWYFFNITLGLVVTFKNIYNHQGSKRHFWETAKGKTNKY